jgi:hypothetical protein
MKESFNPEKFESCLKDIKELIEGNRNLITNEEYLASLNVLTAIDIAIEKASEEDDKKPE